MCAGRLRGESPDDPYSGMGILRVDVGSAWEKSDVLAAVMDALLPDAYALLNCRTLMTKAAPYAVARVATLTECGFVRSDKPVMGHHGERFEYYWVLCAACLWGNYSFATSALNSGIVSTKR